MTAPATPRLLRRMNAQRVLDALRAGGPAARDGARRGDRALAADRRRRGRRPGAARLARGGAPPSAPAAGGRRAASRSARRAGYVVGVDIGEVKVRVAVADLAGEVVAERVRDVRGRDRLRRSAAIAAGDAEGRRASTREQLLVACVGCTGAMDTPRRAASSSAASSRTASTSRARWPARSGRADRDRERLQPGRDRRALVRRRAGHRRHRLRARGRADRRGHHGRRPDHARPRGRGRRARLPRRARGEHGARHRPARPRALRARRPEAVFAAAAPGDEERAGDRRARRALGRQRDRHDRADRQPGGRRDQRRRRPRGRGPARAAARARWRRWCGCRRGSRLRRWPSAARCWARSGSRSTSSSRGCWTGSTKPLSNAWTPFVLLTSLGDAEVDVDAGVGERVAAGEVALALPGRSSIAFEGDAAPPSSRSSSRPIVIHSVGVRASGVVNGEIGERRSVSSARSIGHSIAVPETSPSPWAAWPSPVENSAPSTSIGRYSVVPLTSSLQSRFPPDAPRRDRRVASPGSSGAHAHHAEERLQRHGVAELVDAVTPSVERVGVDDAVADDARGARSTATPTRPRAGPSGPGTSSPMSIPASSRAARRGSPPGRRGRGRRPACGISRARPVRAGR